MPSLNFDSKAITINCPECRAEITKTIGGFRANPSIRCPKCNKAIRVDTSSFDQTVRDLDRQMGGLFKR